MRNYIDPEMNIAMFDAENVVTDPSAVAQANNFFDSNEAGNNGSGDTALTAGVVAAGNVLTFTF